MAKYNPENISIIKGARAARTNAYYLQTVEDNDKIKKTDKTARRNARICLCVALDDGSMKEETAEEVCKRINKKLDEEKHFNSVVVEMTLATMHNLLVRNLIRLNIKNGGKMVVNNEAQRLEAWTPEMMSQYIFDIIRGKYVDMPNMRTVECPSNKDLLIMYPNEGQQRTISLYKFLSGLLEITGTGTWMDGMTFNEFEVDEQMAILNIPIRIMVLDERYRNAHMYSDLFYKTNTCGAHLNDFEKASATKKTVFVDEIRKLVLTPEFTDVVSLSDSKTSRQIDSAIMIHAMALCKAAEIDDNGVPSISNGTQRHYNNRLMDMNENLKKSEVSATIRHTKYVLKLMAKLGMHDICLGERKNKAGITIPAHVTSNKKFVSAYFLTNVLFEAMGQDKTAEIMATGRIAIEKAVRAAMNTNEWATLMNGGTNDWNRSFFLTDMVVAFLLNDRPKIRLDDNDNVIFYENLESYQAKRASILKHQNTTV